MHWSIIVCSHVALFLSLVAAVSHPYRVNHPDGHQMIRVFHGISHSPAEGSTQSQGRSVERDPIFIQHETTVHLPPGVAADISHSSQHGVSHIVIPHHDFAKTAAVSTRMNGHVAAVSFDKRVYAASLTRYPKVAGKELHEIRVTPRQLIPSRPPSPGAGSKRRRSRSPPHPRHVSKYLRTSPSDAADLMEVETGRSRR